jgi:hypothetical protein
MFTTVQGNEYGLKLNDTQCPVYVDDDTLLGENNTINKNTEAVLFTCNETGIK